MDEIELWRGSANAWECDHLQHLNTRFYLTRVEQAVTILLSRMGVERESYPALTAQHMRFHREISAGAAIHATGRAITWSNEGGQLLILFHHSATRALAATFRLWFGIGCNDAPAGVPEVARERGLAMADLAAVEANCARADALGLRRTGLATVLPEDCGIKGDWRLSAAMGMVADAVPHLDHGRWRDILAETDPDSSRRIGSVLIEFGFVHHRWPSDGDRIEVRSAPATCTERVTRTAHWLLDPASGQAWATVSTVGLPLDLDTRRPVVLTPEAQGAFRASAVADA